MNLDPRSASQNTEMGVVVDSPQLAREMLRIIKISKLQNSYRLRLAKEGGTLEWLTNDGQKGSHPDERARVGVLPAPV